MAHNNSARANERIPRFSLMTRFIHWSNVATFFLLFFTGMSLYIEAFAPLSLLFGGPVMAKLLHRVAAVIFMVTPTIGVLMNPKGFAQLVKEVFTWDKDDIGMIKGFTNKFFGDGGKIPPQGRLNGGQKINTIIIISGCNLLALTGLVIWFPDYFSDTVVRWSFIGHDLLATGIMALVIGHMFLGWLHPGSGESIEAMTKGSLRRGFAEHHHAKWVAEYDAQQAKK